MMPAPHAPRGPTLTVGRARGLATGLLLCALLASGAWAPAAHADAQTVACVESFARFQRAFESRSADTVVGCMQPEGALALTLLGVAGRPEPMKREQALKVLRSYFELVSAPKLVARAGQPADALVRAYDYTRRLRSGDPSTTRLTVTLKKDAGGTLRLHSVVETAR